MRILWIDCETGGLEPRHHEILTIAGIIEIDRRQVDEFHYKLRPNFPERLEESALKCNGLTREQVMKFDDPFEVFEKLKEKFSKYGLRREKLIVAGHNVAAFDRKFLNELFVYHGCETLHYYLDYHSLDTMSVAAWLRYVGKLKIKTLKLGALCEHFEIPLKAHDALEDIRATRQLAIKLWEMLR